MKRILYVHSRKASFVAIDREILAERYEIEDLYQPGRLPNPLKVIRGVLRADLVFGWFASWHTFFPITLAWLLRKPSVLVIGGFDVANMPDIGYGHQQGGLRRLGEPLVMFRRAKRLVTNSNYSLSEIERNTPVPPARGDGHPPRRARPLRRAARRAEAAGRSDRRRGRPRGRSSRRASFRSRGRRATCPTFASCSPASGSTRRSTSCAPPAARTSSSPAGSRTRTCSTPIAGAAVYVQASRHEGFGLAVAEAMLAGCVPVVMNVTAMPEVVGDAGVLIESQDPRRVAAGIRAALELGPPASAAARERILTAFPMDRRREGILRVVEEALAG